MVSSTVTEESLWTMIWLSNLSTTQPDSWASAFPGKNPKQRKQKKRLKALMRIYYILYKEIRYPAFDFLPAAKASVIPRAAMRNAIVDPMASEERSLSKSVFCALLPSPG